MSDSLPGSRVDRRVLFGALYGVALRRTCGRADPVRPAPCDEKMPTG